jgi:hypothetical protein
MDHPTVTVQSGTPEAPTTQTFVISPANIALILQQLISAEPKIVAIMSELGPFAAVLPAPFNILSNPLIQEAASALPTLLPLLQNLENILNQMAPPVPVTPPPVAT